MDEIQSCITSSGEENDGLSRLPQEVLLSILSRLSMKEAARTGVLSHKWKEHWADYPGVLNFEYSRTKEEFCSRTDLARISQDTSDFVNWVTRVVEQHHGASIEEFKVAFDLDNTYQSHIDKWVVSALAKGVKSLEFDFNARHSILIRFPYTLPLECCNPLKCPYNLASTKPRLRTLVLKSIIIATEVLECFLHSCPFLENLHIRRSRGLTSIRVSGLPLALKHLDVSECSKLENIDILAPKLLTFGYKGQPIQLQIRNASLLSEVSVAGERTDPLAYAFDSLSEYFSRLEYLHLSTSLLSEMNLVLPPISNLTNLKHLRLTIEARCTQSLLGWISLIQASPVLQKLTLELGSYNWLCDRILGKHDNPQPLKCLKTLEVFGFVGRIIDLELATYVFENAVVLDEVVLDFKHFFSKHAIRRPHVMKARVMELKRKLPAGARLLVNDWL
ncbi:hypothetical protein Cgig2_019412 [Carnegiea gigantea]|uniref:F-box domain-containing protein n=1 Tax=Carnegiea gigantea TaxID=171969 RepID=A0A9Q1QM67_9CARY|nr:hypothetical protein Cgig2_019411 [Carnegiea gigantea]KAJ8447418.1 hypothetical protein Cgig2_019412 [Carnegiea gigantea]